MPPPYKSGAQRAPFRQWRIQDFCEGDAAGVRPPIFFGRDDPNFLRQIVSAHRRVGFSEVGCAQGWIQDFWLGDDGGAEGPERGAKRRSAECGGVWRGVP